MYVYGTLKSLFAPHKLSHKTYQHLMVIFKKPYLPRKSEVSEWFRLNKDKQQADQTVSDYRAKLRKLASICSFGAFLEETLKDKACLSSET